MCGIFSFAFYDGKSQEIVFKLCSPEANSECSVPFI